MPVPVGIDLTLEAEVVGDALGVPRAVWRSPQASSDMAHAAKGRVGLCGRGESGLQRLLTDHMQLGRSLPVAKEGASGYE